MDYKLYAVRVFVKDWQAAMQFYQDTLGMKVFFSDEEMGWAQFDLGGAYIGLEKVSSDDAEEAKLIGRFVGVSLQVKTVAPVYDALVAKGVEFIAPPEKQPWGGVLAHFKDLEGNVLTLLGD